MPLLRRWSTLAALAAPLALSLGGCSADLTVPPDTAITCAGGSCPDGFTCNAKLERCIWNPDIDTVPPALAAPAVLAPSVDVGGVPVTIARAGTLVTVTFTVTEPLRFDPAVTVALGLGRSRPLALVEQSGLQYVYGYYVTGFDEPETDCAVTIHLEDAQGVEASAPGGSIRFDLQKPLVDSVTLDPTHPLKAGTTLALHLTVSEPLGAPPSVTFLFDPTTEFTATGWNGARTYDFEYPIPADPSALPEGPQQILVGLTDLAGNASTGIPAGNPTFDFTPPDLLPGTVNVDPVGAAGANQTVLLTFTASEPLAALPVVLLGTDVPFAEEPSALLPPQFKFSHTVNPPPPTGTGTDTAATRFFDVQLEDAAGNVAHVTGPAVTFKFTPPEISFLRSCPWVAGEETLACPAPAAGWTDTYSTQAGHDLIKVSFSLDETPSSLQLTLGGSPTGLCTGSNAYKDWICLLGASGTSGQVTQAALVITAGDSAGNQKTGTLTLTFDNRAPVLSGAEIQRCDGYGPAMSGSTAVWLKDPATLVGSACPHDSPPCDLSGNVRVTLTLDEAIQKDPTDLQVADVELYRTGLVTPIPLDVARCTTSANTVIAYFPDLHAYYPDLGSANGPWEIRARWVDAFGNASPLATVASFQLDTIPPAAPQTAAAGQVIYTRAAAGTTEAQGEAAVYRVDALPGTTSTPGPLQAVLLPGGPDPVPVACAEATQLIPYAWIPVAADGSFTCGLTEAAPTELWVAAEDAAGNRSPPAIVHDGRYTGKWSAGNPLVHQHHWRPVTEGDAFSALPEETIGYPRFEAITGPETNPGAAGYCAATWVPERGSVLMFGGRKDASTTYRDTLWSWDGRAWSSLVASAPSALGARTGVALAHDRKRGRTVLFGGRASAGNRCDTWELEGTTWTQVVAPTTCSAASPTARRGAAMFWDRTRERVLLFGGYNSTNGVDNDLWEWTGSAWAELAHTDPWPTRRAFALVATNTNPASATYGYTLLMSGSTGNENSPDEEPNDVYAWNGATWTRSSRGGRTAVDFDYREAQLWYDANVDQFLLYRPADNLLYAWSFADGWFQPLTSPGILGSQTALAASASAPCGAFDEERGAFVRFGGCADGTLCTAHDETFAWVAGAWRQLHPSTAPAPRAGAAAAWDPVAADAFVWGGTGAAPPELFDGWRFDGWRWNGGASVGTAGVTGASLVAWGAGGPLLRFGGTGDGNVLASTWALGTGWTRGCSETSCATYVEPIPFAELGALDGDEQALAYFESGTPATGKLLFYRGKDVLTAPASSATWVGLYDAATPDALVAWSARDDALSRPDSRRGHRLTTCATANGGGPAVLLFGGHDGAQYRQDLWIWNVATETWSLATPEGGVKPAARAGHVQLCDAASGTLVVIGGEAGGAPLADVWAWDGVRWTERTPPVTPAARSGAVGVSLGAPGQALLFGGADGAGLRDDTWLWRSGGGSRPAHVFKATRFGFPADRLTSLTVDWRGGATSQSAGALTAGIELYRWTGRGWETTAAVNGTAHDAAALDTAVWNAPAPFAPYLGGALDALTVAAVPKGVSGSGVATVKTQHVDVKANYWLCVGSGLPAPNATDCCVTTGLIAGVCP